MLQLKSRGSRVRPSHVKPFRHLRPYLNASCRAPSASRFACGCGAPAKPCPACNTSSPPEPPFSKAISVRPDSLLRPEAGQRGQISSRYIFT